MPKVRNGNASRKRVPVPAVATAAPQALGYGLQYTRLTAVLLEAPEGAMCSMEVLDDVAEEAPSGAQRFVQSKSALGDNPVSDRSVSLWKTLFNWLQLLHSGAVRSDNAIFELYVSRPAKGPLVALFHAADSEEKARNALAKARDELWGNSPSFPKKKQLREDLARFVNAVLSADESQVASIITKMRLVCGGGSPQSDLEAIIRRHPVSQSKIRMIADHMCGWVKRRVDERLELSLPAVLSRDEFHGAYTTFCRAIDRAAILSSLARTPTEHEKIERLPDVFVRQLNLIDVPFEEQLGAISDFLRACWDRAHWAAIGDVDETSFDDLTDALQRTWRNHIRTNEIEHRAKCCVDRGQLLYARCMQHTALLQGMTPPAHFIPGCFHRLADGREIGWHPEFRTLLDSTSATP